MARTLQGYLGVKDYAKLCGLTPVAIYKALNDGRLAGYKVGNTWVIHKDAVIKNKRSRDGRFIGISDLKRGDMETFLEKRGYQIERE